MHPLPKFNKSTQHNKVHVESAYVKSISAANSLSNANKVKNAHHITTSVHHIMKFAQNIKTF